MGSKSSELAIQTTMNAMGEELIRLDFGSKDVEKYRYDNRWETISYVESFHAGKIHKALSAAARFVKIHHKEIEVKGVTVSTEDKEAGLPFFTRDEWGWIVNVFWTKPT